jgi:transcriptional regulator with XRE-family HTH domain
MDISNKMILLRKERNWSQTELSKLVGCSRELISKYEKGLTTPSIDFAKKIADAFGVTIDYLAGEGQNATFDKKMLQRIQALQNLDKEIQEKVFFVIDAILRDTQTQQAYS